MKNFFKLIKRNNCINIVFLLGFLATPLNAKLRDLQTTRLMSTSGTGVGAILLNEAALLNPASIYFFQNSSFYYQRGNASLEEGAPIRGSDYEEGENQIFLITDTSSALKGGFSYQTQEENGESRKRFSSSASTHLGKNSSFGIIYRYTEEDARSHDVYHQAVLGLTHVFSNELSFGVVMVDPFLANKEDALLAAGFQFRLAQNLLALGDLGTNFNDEPQNNTFIRGAVQVEFFNYFYMKYGQFLNKNKGLEGSSWGLSWIGPKLALEYANKISEVVEDGSDIFDGEKIVEHSLAASVVF